MLKFGFRSEKVKSISMKIVDYWHAEENEEKFYDDIFIKILSTKYDIKYSDKPDFLLYGPFGYRHMDFDNCIKIFFTGENVRTDWNVADYALDFDLMDFGDRHLCLPLYMLYTIDFVRALEKHRNAEKIMESKSRFCGFLASNPGGDPYRKKLFHAINSYKRVDSGGLWLNNIGKPLGKEGGFPDSKFNWLKPYKFNLAPENSTYPGYVTEKIIQAYGSGCVPIYWGDYSICNEKYCDKRFIFNPKAFINVHDFDNFDNLIDEIRRIDNDEEAYFNMLKEPIFIDLERGKNLDSKTEYKDMQELLWDIWPNSEDFPNHIYIYIYIWLGKRFWIFLVISSTLATQSEFPVRILLYKPKKIKRIIV